VFLDEFQGVPSRKKNVEKVEKGNLRKKESLLTGFIKKGVKRSAI